MFKNLLGLMAMTVYNQMYGANSILKTIERYDKILAGLIGTKESMFDENGELILGGFMGQNSYYANPNGTPTFILVKLLGSIMTIAAAICVLLYFIDLSEKVTEKNFSTEQFFKATLRMVTSYMFILNSADIVGLLIHIGSSAANNMVFVDNGFDIFGPTEKEWFITGIGNLEVSEILSYIVSALIPWLLSLIGEVIVQIILISRIIEISVLVVFAPLAIADIYREGTASSGVNYMKKMFALGLQVAVIILINIATQSIIVAIGGSANGLETMLQLDTTTMNCYTRESIEKFLNIIFGEGNKLEVYGILLARVGLIWNSMSLCEEITGAR